MGRKRNEERERDIEREREKQNRSYRSGDLVILLLKHHWWNLQEQMCSRKNWEEREMERVDHEENKTMDR